MQLKDFRWELGILIAESGQPLHVAKTQLGHSSVRTTEQYYARYYPEFAVSRAREVMEARGRQVGDTERDSATPENLSQKHSRKLLDFREFKKRRRADSNR